MRALHLLSSALGSFPDESAPTPPVLHRNLGINDLSGNVPSQLGALTALTQMCATTLQQPA